MCLPVRSTLPKHPFIVPSARKAPAEQSHCKCTPFFFDCDKYKHDDIQCSEESRRRLPVKAAFRCFCFSLCPPPGGTRHPPPAGRSVRPGRPQRVTERGNSWHGFFSCQFLLCVLTSGFCAPRGQWPPAGQGRTCAGKARRVCVRRDLGKNRLMALGTTWASCHESEETAKPALYRLVVPGLCGRSGISQKHLQCNRMRNLSATPLRLNSPESHPLLV